MKHTMIIMVFILGIITNAQTSSENVDLHKMVKEQMELVLAKEEYNKLTSSDNVAKDLPGSTEVTEVTAGSISEEDEGKIEKDDIIKMLQQEENVAENSKKETESAQVEDNVKSQSSFIERKPYVVKRIPLNKPGNSIGWKLLVIAVTALAAAGVIVYRRMKQKNNKDESSLKKNIKLIREEKVIRKDLNPYLMQIRKQLKDSAGRGGIDDKVVTETARKLRISREEILLANRIHKHEMKNA